MWKGPVFMAQALLRVGSTIVSSLVRPNAARRGSGADRVAGAAAIGHATLRPGSGGGIVPEAPTTQEAPAAASGAPLVRETFTTPLRERTMEEVDPNSPEPEYDDSIEIVREDEGEPAPAGQMPLETTPLMSDAELWAVLEAIVYVTEEPVTAEQIAAALGQPAERVKRALEEFVSEYNGPVHGVMIREVAGGYKMATKPEHHEAMRAFAKSLKPPLKLSLAALETLATIAYKQPITAPEVMEIRGVQGAGVLKTLLERKLIQTAGRKSVVGRPILYKTTKDFLVQFGLKDLSELPTLKEFEELGRLAISESEVEAAPGGTTESTAQEAGPAGSTAASESDAPPQDAGPETPNA